MKAPRLFAVLAVTSTAHAQTTFPETEPNSIKAEASVVGCLTANDVITGTTTGAVTGVGMAGFDTVDYFKLSTCALPLGIYRHTLTLSTTTPGHTGQMRGLSQAGTVGIGGIPNAASDVAIQNLTGTQQHWYAFGKSEVLIIRVQGTPSTTAPYNHTLSTSPVSSTVIGPFAAGSITITTEAQGHATDTEMWLYDANLSAIPGFGNDDTYLDPVGEESTLTRTLAAGTYYLALGTYNFKNDQASPADDDWVNGPLMEFPDAAAEDSGADPGDVAFAVTDSAGTTAIAATKSVWYEILWFKFDVTSPSPGVAFCHPGSGGVMACQCGNPSGPGVGCGNTGSSGASLSSTGTASLASDATDPGSVQLTGNSMLSGSSCIFLQGDSLLASGTTFGAGIRCAGGQLLRLYVKPIVGGSQSAPLAADRSISNRCGDLGAPIPSGQTRYYQTYFRDPNLANPGGGCPAIATFNVSSAQQIAWAP